jgi:hypothetical protein
MARSFNGSNQFLGASHAAVNVFPFTACGWFKFVNFSNIYCPLVVGSNGSGAVIMYFSVNPPFYAVCTDGTNFPLAEVTTSLSANTWYHMAASASWNGVSVSITAYLNGTNKTTGGGTLSFGGGMVNSYIGVFDDGSSYKLNGAAADVAVWDVILSDGEIAALASGARPGWVRPGSLAAWYPLFGLSSPEPDLSGAAHNMVLTNAPPIAADPPVMMFTPRWPQFNISGVVSDILMGAIQL